MVATFRLDLTDQENYRGPITDVDFRARLVGRSVLGSARLDADFQQASRRGLNQMRIDFVITELFAGGAERCLTELVLGLTASGDSVRVFSCGSLPTGPQQHLLNRLESAGIEVKSGGTNSPMGVFSVYRQLRNWLRDSKPDVCQTFLHHANVLGTLAAKSAGIPIRVGGVRVAETRPLRCRLERMAVQRMHSVVCVSRAVEQFAHQRLGCHANHSIVIPNGVDARRFAAAAPADWSSIGWPADAVVSLYIGRLHAQKGIELLQQQIDSIAPVGSNRRLLLVGDGPLRKDLQAWVNRVGESRAQLLPWRSDVAPLMRACRVLVLPSHYEGMPNVVLEAMAAGRPVVCSRVQGSDELLGHARDQQTFPAGDSAEMKCLVERYLSDEALGARVGSENQARVQSDFSIPAMVEAYRAHYRMLLGRRCDVA